MESVVNFGTITGKINKKVLRNNSSETATLYLTVDVPPKSTQGKMTSVTLQDSIDSERKRKRYESLEVGSPITVYFFVCSEKVQGNDWPHQYLQIKSIDYTAPKNPDYSNSADEPSFSGLK